MDTDLDQRLVAAAFAVGADEGWSAVTVASAARRAGVDLLVARMRFGAKRDILRKFGEQADVYALTGALDEGSVRERLFDILLRRFDFLQMHRAGVLALMRVLPREPALAACLAHATVNSMGWVLEGAGVRVRGLRGEVAKRGLGVVWAYGLRSWTHDASPDLTATMAAVDTALSRADLLAARFFTASAASSPGETTELA